MWAGRVPKRSTKVPLRVTCPHRTIRVVIRKAPDAELFMAALLDSGRRRLGVGLPSVAVLLLSCLTVALLLLAIAAQDALATFPGRNGRIAYVTESGYTRVILSVRPDGTGRRVLVRGVVHSPAYSRSGRRIAFGVEYAWLDHGLEVARANGRGRRRLTRGTAFNISWSPDGRQLVFTRSSPCDEWYEFEEDDCPARLKRRQSGLLVYRRGRTRVLRPAALDSSWSPAGRWIVFEGRGPLYAPDGRWDWGGLHLIRPNGSGMRRDLLPEPAGEQNPDWSPDGRRIVFSYYPDGRPLRDQVRVRDGIATIRPDGTGFRPLATNGGRNPVYSPDGRWIVFEKDNVRCEFSALWIMRADGTQQRPLRYPSGRPICGRQPDWQPIPR
jgi:hypothetical protein